MVQEDEIANFSQFADSAIDSLEKLVWEDDANENNDENLDDTATDFDQFLIGGSTKSTWAPAKSSWSFYESVHDIELKDDDLGTNSFPTENENYLKTVLLSTAGCERVK